jgi:hypothetical protein
VKNILQESSALSSDTIVARRDRVIAAEVDHEIVALNIDDGMCYGLNRVGSRIWNLLAQPIRIADLCVTLLTEYRVDPEDCEQQVLALLEQLRIENLIVTFEKT